jgi:hypothetical protein
LLPAVQAAREAARRAQSTNNMKQIGLAMLNYCDANRKFPPAYTADKQGKPLLSWRVLILPYLDQAALYGQFHLDEPWDSEHNKKLIDLMPPEYRNPNAAAGPGLTNYLTVRGEHTAFPGKEGIALQQITDGTSYTIMAVEADNERSVPWTKLDDFQYDDKNPMAGLFGMRPGGVLAAFCDGSVRLIPAQIGPDNLKAFFIRDSGKPKAQF